MALHYKGIEFEHRVRHLLRNGGEQLTEEYGKVNPQHLVPALVIDGVTLTQSVAIMEYLEETRPQQPILPKEAKLRAKVRQLVQLVVSDTQPVQNLRVLKNVGLERKLEWGSHWIEESFL